MNEICSVMICLIILESNFFYQKNYGPKFLLSNRAVFVNNGDIHYCNRENIFGTYFRIVNV